MPSLTPVNLENVNKALDIFAALGSQRMFEPQAVQQSEIGRNNFRCICDRPGAYETVRELMKEQAYWDMEETHFRKVNNLILLYNYRAGTAERLVDVVCPPMDVIRYLVEESQTAVESSASGKYQIPQVV